MSSRKGMNWSSHSHRGAGDLVVHTKVYDAVCPEHERDVYLAQLAHSKMSKAVAAIAARGEKGTPNFQKVCEMKLWTRDVCHSLATRGPFYKVTEKCRAALLKIAGLKELPPLKETSAPSSLRDLPKRPPQAPKKDEGQDE